MECSGRGHHKRRKKGARKCFFRTKNDERKRQQASKDKRQHEANKENQVTFGDVKQDMMNIPVPEHWMILGDGDKGIQWSKVEVGASGLRETVLSVLLRPDLSWSVHAYGKKVPTSCKVLSAIPTTISTHTQAKSLLYSVHQAAPCPGNPDERFVTFCEERGGTMNRSGDKIAFIDRVPVVDCDGQNHSCSVRRVDCDVICQRVSRYPVRCKFCQTYRNGLRSAVSRSSRSDTSSNTAASSHTNYVHLTPTEKTERLKKLHEQLKISKCQRKRLEVKIKKLIERESVSVQPADDADITRIVDEVSPIVEQQFPKDSPQRVFWDQQRMYNQLKNKRAMRWHPLVLRFALNLKYVSSSAYRAVRESGIIHLPSERTLHDYTHWSTSTAQSGVQFEFIEEFHTLISESLPSHQHQCAMSMDEMKIKSGLVFNKHSGTLVGFVDLGTVNEDIEKVVCGEQSELTTEKQLAEQVFVLMARAVFKPSLCVPVAHYFSSNLKGEKIFPIVWEVTEALELFDIPVVSLTSDGAKPNRRFYRLSKLKDEKSSVPYKTTNPFRADSNLYFFCDAPHLLKTTRNCFSNSYAHSRSRKLKKGGQDITWRWIEHLYFAETSTTSLGVRMCHKLTTDHVWLTSYTRMRVYLAAQVMSESVASALGILDDEETRETRLFIRMVDRFFDYLNVKSPKAYQLQRKESVAPYRTGSDERFKWLKGDFLTYLMEWEQEVASVPGLSKTEQQRMCLSHETRQGLRITVMSFTELGPQLLKVPGVSYLLSEVFSQDPLERYFSRQRHRGGSNDNPTAYQVPFNANTLLQQQSIYKDLKTMNVNADTESIDLETVSQPLRKRQRKKQ